MGMSASQARFLSLTAKKSDLEFQAQQISQRRVEISNTTDEVQAKYSEKMNNMFLSFKRSEVNETASLTYSEFITDGAFKDRYFLTNSNGMIVVASKDEIPKDADPKKYYIDPHLNESDYFETQLKDGLYFITENNEENKPIQKDLSMVSVITEEYDTSDDAPAQAEYDTQMKKLQNKDKKLELELDKIESEHKAIETEMESVENVIKKNVEDTFKTFS